jgi:murein DD-endopeptidase MepM/ murein hydrolase activator NlpD
VADADGRLPRRAALGALLGGGAMLASGCGSAEAQTPGGTGRAGPLALDLTGDATQSGTMLGQTAPDATVRLDDVTTRADAQGRFIIGFDRDAPPAATVQVTAPDGRTASRVLQIAPRTWRVTTISGLPPRTVNPPAEAMARIERESALKQRAFASEDPLGTGYTEPFDWPLASIRVTSPWGAQRRLNGSLQRPHYGIDLGAPTGTPIRAPAPGIVVIAEPDMWFEGGMVALDHGQGLITTYLHMSRLDVRVGQRLERGARIGAVGARGRATGPHLCWRMRWRGRQLDPSLRTA